MQMVSVQLHLTIGKLLMREEGKYGCHFVPAALFWGKIKYSCFAFFDIENSYSFHVTILLIFSVIFFHNRLS